MYKSGPVYAFVARDEHKDYGGAGLNDTGTILGGVLTFGNTKLSLIVERPEYETGVGATTKRDARSVGVAHKIGGNIIRAAYTIADDSTGNGAAVGGIGAPSAANDTGAKQVSLGYGYELSKRAEVYAHYTKITNEASARYDLINTPLSIGAGTDPQVLGLGVVVRF